MKVCTLQKNAKAALLCVSESTLLATGCSFADNDSGKVRQEASLALHSVGEEDQNLVQPSTGSDGAIDSTTGITKDNGDNKMDVDGEEGNGSNVTSLSPPTPPILPPSFTDSMYEDTYMSKYDPSSLLAEHGCVIRAAADCTGLRQKQVK